MSTEPPPEEPAPDRPDRVPDEPPPAPLVPPSPPVPPPSPPPAQALPPGPWHGAPPVVNPYQRTGLNWLLVLVGMVVGFVAWVVGSFLVLAVSGTLPGTSDVGGTIALVVFVLLFLAAIGLIVWPRTRRLGQGIVLGAAIGLVVAGGLCIPLVASF